MKSAQVYAKRRELKTQIKIAKRTKQPVMRFQQELQAIESELTKPTIYAKRVIRADYD